jgi:nucleoside-diphosphate-sugar epimerase
MIDKASSIVVTGGKGFLGTAICRKLKDNGYHNVHTFRSKHLDLTSPGAAYYMYDIYKPKVVIHLAAKVGGIGANMANPGSFAFDNLMMGMNVIEGARKYGFLKKLVIAGTVCAYPCHCPVPFKEDDLWKDFPEPTNAPYGLAKKMLLVIAQGYRKQYGLNSIFLLPTNLYGPGDHFDLENSHVIPAMLRKFHEAKVAKAPSVTLWGDGSPSREFLYVFDAAEAFVAAMENYDSPEPMNVGTGTEIVMSKLARLVKATVGYDGQVVWDRSRPNGQPRRCLDLRRAFNSMSWRPHTNFEDGLRRTYEYYLKHEASRRRKASRGHLPARNGSRA